MPQCEALTIWTTRYLSIVALMVTLLACSSVYADTQFTNFSGNARFPINDRLLIDIKCSERQLGDGFCSFKTDMQYSRYLNTHLSVHESHLFPGSAQDQRKVDLLAIFKLAIEEFKFLSDVKLYWELTEQNLEKLAIKLRLKGEIPISEPSIQYHATGKGHKGQSPSTRGQSKRTSHHSSMLALFLPSKLQWNLGMNPNDRTVFGELNLNPYVILSGEFGDTNLVGIYFRYPF